MQNVMVDIETLDTGPDAVVLSIGAVAFDGKTPLKDLPQHYDRLMFQSQLDKGRKVSASTLQWWMQQDHTAQQAAFLMGSETPPYSALTHLIGFISSRTEGGIEGALMWANSPSFDLTILRSLAGDFFQTPPLWNFRNERDLRTLRATAGLRVAPGPADLGYVAHHPIGDCMAQIEVVRRCYANLGLDLDGE